MIYNLPLPPSTNALFFNLPGGGRAKTKAYTNWIRDARWALLAQRARPVAGMVRVAIELTDKARIDLDNAVKATMDALVAHGIIEDDRKKFVRAISLEWSSEVEGVRVTIRPATVKAADAGCRKPDGRFRKRRFRPLTEEDSRELTG